MRLKSQAKLFQVLVTFLVTIMMFLQAFLAMERVIFSCLYNLALLNLTKNYFQLNIPIQF